MSFDEDTNEHEEADDAPGVFDVLADVDGDIADILDDLDDSTVEDDTQILNAVVDPDHVLATTLDEAADHDDEDDDEPVAADDDEDDDEDDAQVEASDDEDEDDEPQTQVTVEDEYDEEDIEDLAEAAFNDPDIQEAFDDNEPVELLGDGAGDHADAFAAAMSDVVQQNVQERVAHAQVEATIKADEQETKRAEQQRLTDELDHYEKRYQELQAKVIKESERLEALNMVKAAEKGAQDVFDARINKSEPELVPAGGVNKLREWQLDFGPLWAPAGLVSTITLTPQCTFRGEKIMATDSYSSPGYGTRILAVAVGQKIQRAGNDQGTLTAMLTSTSLADGVLHDTAHKWATISVTVSFVQSCTFDMTVFGKAVLLDADDKVIV